MAEPTAALLVRIGADAKQLFSTLDLAEKKLGKTEQAFDLATKAAKVFAAGAAALGTALALLVNRQAGIADQAVKTAAKLGVTVEALTELRYAAELSGVKVQTFDMALQRFGRRAAEAATGTGEAQAALKELGIQLRDGNGRLRSSDELLGDVADAMKGVATDGDRLRLAFKLFDSEGVAMVNMLRDGKAGLMGMREEARILGASLDSEAGQAAVEFKNNLTRLQAVQTGLANTLMAELLPAFQVATDAMIGSAKEAGGFRDEMKGVAGAITGGAVTAFQTLAVVGSDVAFVFKMIGGEIGVWAAQLAALAQGDFSRFSFIGDEWTKDAEQARKDLDDFQNRVMQIGKTIEEARGGKVPTAKTGGGGGRGGLSEAEKEKQRKHDEEMAILIQEGLDEEARIRQEAWDAYVKFRDEQLQHEKDVEAARIQVLLDAEDERQRIALEAGEEEIRIAEEVARGKDEARKRDLAGAMTFLSNLASLTNTNSKKMFELGKKAAIAEASVKGAQAVMDAWQAGMSVGGPFAPAIAAAYAAAAGLNAINLISNIKQQQFGGGFSNPVAVGQGTSGISQTQGLAASANGGAQQTTLIRLEGGDMYSREQVRGLINRIEENTRDGGKVRIL